MIFISNKYISVLRMNWIQALEYRANALVGIIAILSGLFIEYQIRLRYISLSSLKNTL